MKKLLQALLEIQKETRALAKDAKANGYAYLSGDKLLNHIRPKMDELGVVLAPEILEITNDRVDYSTRSGNKSAMFTALKMRFTWWHVESGESLSCDWAANGMNDWDKGAGSAMTYGHRYFLIKFFSLPTDKDDVDAQSGEEGAPVLPSTAPVPSTAQVPQLEDLTPSHPKWVSAKAAVQAGSTTVMAIRKKYKLTTENELLLTQK